MKSLFVAAALLLSVPALAQNTRGVTTKTATEVGATGPESWLGDTIPAKVKVWADVSKASACKYRLDIWDGNQRAWVPGTAEKPCISTPETVTLSYSFARVYITQLTGSVTFTLDSSQ